MKTVLYGVSVFFLTACVSTPNIDQIRAFSSSAASVSSTLSSQGGAINRDTRRYFIREALDNPGLSIRDSEECSQEKSDAKKIASISTQFLPGADTDAEPLFCLQNPVLNSQRIGAIAQVFSSLGAYSRTVETLSSDGLRTSATTAIDNLETQLTTANTALIAANVQGENNDTISEVSAVIQLLARAATENQRREAVRDTVAEAIPLYRGIIDRYEHTFTEYARLRQWLPRTRFVKTADYYEFREVVAASDRATRSTKCRDRFLELVGVNNCIENYDDFSPVERRRLLGELDALAPLQGQNFDKATQTLFSRMNAVLDELEVVVEKDISADTESFREAVRLFTSSATAYTRASNALEFPALGE